MFNNLEFSKVIIYELYKMFKVFEHKTNNQNERKEIVILLVSLLTLDDVHSMIRYQYFFGIPKMTINPYLEGNIISFKYVSPKEMSDDLEPKKTIQRICQHKNFMEVFEHFTTLIINEEKLFKYLSGIPSISTESSR